MVGRAPDPSGSSTTSPSRRTRCPSRSAAALARARSGRGPGRAPRPPRHRGGPPPGTPRPAGRSRSRGTATGATPRCGAAAPPPARSPTATRARGPPTAVRVRAHGRKRALRRRDGRQVTAHVLRAARVAAPHSVQHPQRACRVRREDGRSAQGGLQAVAVAAVVVPVRVQGGLHRARGAVAEVVGEQALLQYARGEPHEALRARECAARRGRRGERYGCDVGHGTDRRGGHSPRGPWRSATPAGGILGACG